VIYGKGGWADGRIETFAINPTTGVFAAPTDERRRLASEKVTSRCSKPPFARADGGHCEFC
jgi:hypothetical protein